MSWQDQLKTAVSGSGGTAAETPQSPQIPKETKTSHQRPYTLRYRKNNQMVTGTILASSEEKAEAVGRAWCAKQSTGLIAPVRYIGVDGVLADEGILNGN